MFSDQCAVYYPEELKLLGSILDEVGRSLPPNLRTAFGYEYRSKATLFGLQVIEIVLGRLYFKRNTINSKAIST